MTICALYVSNMSINSIKMCCALIRCDLRENLCRLTVIRIFTLLYVLGCSSFQRNESNRENNRCRQQGEKYPDGEAKEGKDGDCCRTNNEGNDF